jgi:hypothetical protein
VLNPNGLPSFASIRPEAETISSIFPIVRSFCTLALPLRDRPLSRMLRSLVLLLLAAATASTAEMKTRNVVLISTDGLRWQEVFRGAEKELMNKADGGVPDAAKLSEQFWAESPGERRAKLMPFLWGTIAREGQIHGNRDLNSLGDVMNGMWFSYPGYNEFLTGHVDPGIISNKPIPNPNITVLEWLHGRPGFAGKVCACNAWDVLPAILNKERSRIPMFTTNQRSAPGTVSPRIAELERWMADIPSPWGEEHFDAFVQRAAIDFIDTYKPRVLYVNYGETDEWAHARRYDRYLEAARRVDAWIGELWNKLQADPSYRGTTSLIVTTDHGRGVLPKDWTGHGESVPRSGEWWCAVMGPDTPALGERRESAPVKQAQIAGTLAALLGEDYRAAEPRAAEPIAEAIAVPKR